METFCIFFCVGFLIVVTCGRAKLIIASVMSVGNIEILHIHRIWITIVKLFHNYVIWCYSSSTRCKFCSIFLHRLYDHLGTPTVFFCQYLAVDKRHRLVRLIAVLVSSRFWSIYSFIYFGLSNWPLDVAKNVISERLNSAFIFPFPPIIIKLKNYSRLKKTFFSFDDYWKQSSCPGLRSRRISSDSDSRLSLWTPTPPLNPLRLRLNKSYSMLRRAICCIHFLHLHFDRIQTGDTAIQHQFALTANATGRCYRWFLWLWSVWQSLNIFPWSNNYRDAPKFIADTLYPMTFNH